MPNHLTTEGCVLSSLLQMPGPSFHLQNQGCLSIASLLIGSRPTSVMNSCVRNLFSNVGVAPTSHVFNFIL